MSPKTKKRMTKQRKKILEVVKNTDTHPTADWIYEEVKKDIPNISLGTVYRNLNVLAEMDEIMVLEYGSNHSRYDGNAHEHYHFHCQNCGNVYDLWDVDFKEKLNQEVEEKASHKVFNHRLEFYGLCADCQTETQEN